MPLLSVIIPVYKVEKYLRECVDSVLSQDVTDLEVILVDDGSPDGSPAICDEYVEKDKRVLVEHKINGGISSARNAGIRKSSGKYICFLDSDDKWNPDVSLFCIMKKLIENPDVDILLLDCCEFIDGKEGLLHRIDYISSEQGKPFLDLYYEMVKKGNIQESACTKIFKNSFIKEGQFYFQEGLLGEDTEWMFRIYRSQPSVMICDEKLFMCRLGRAGSITNTKSAKSVEDLIKVINQSSEYYGRQVDLSRSIRSAELGQCTALWFIALSMLPEIHDRETRRGLEQKLKEMRWILAYRLSRKTKIAFLSTKLLGIRLTSRILCFYSNKVRVKANTMRIKKREP